MMSVPANPSEPRVSVALCTYNGAAYLAEQLDSLCVQTRLPDELVVCDDHSTDGTLAILEVFAKRSPFPIRIAQNAENLGVTENFSFAIERCSGEVIFLADQDDVWQPEKIERMLDRLWGGMDWICCDADVVDESLDPLEFTLWQRVNFLAAEQRRAAAGDWLAPLLKHYVVAGATVAFRAEFRSQVLPIPHDWPYDAWIAVVLAAIARGGLVSEPLQQYRQHAGNSVGGIGRSLVQEIKVAFRLNRKRYYAGELASWAALDARLALVNAPASAKARVAAKRAHLERRAALPGNRLLRLPIIVREVFSGGYSRYARNWGSIAIDVLIG